MEVIVAGRAVVRALPKSCAVCLRTTFANLSLQSGKFPSCYKKAQDLPLLKKPGLESSSRNPDPNVRGTNYHQNLVIPSLARVPPFHGILRNRLSSVYVANKQTDQLTPTKT